MTMLAVLGIIVLLSLYTIEKRRAKRTTNVDGFVIKDGHPIPRKGVRDQVLVPGGGIGHFRRESSAVSGVVHVRPGDRGRASRAWLLGP
jgi:hypothetical protein